MIVRHPVFSEITKDVADPSQWVAAGWVPDIPRPRPRPRRKQKYPLI